MELSGKAGSVMGDTLLMVLQVMMGGLLIVTVMSAVCRWFAAFAPEHVLG